MQCGGFSTCIGEYKKAKGGLRLRIADMLNDPLHQPGKHKHRRGYHIPALRIIKLEYLWRFESAGVYKIYNVTRNSKQSNFI